MRLRNTCGIPDETVRQVVEWVAETLGIGGFDVECRNCSGTLAGMAYSKGSSYHATSKPFVVLRVGTEHTRPQWIVKKDGQTIVGPRRALLKYGAENIQRIHRVRFPAIFTPYQYAQHRNKKYVIASRIEALVYIAAHELRHIWQSRRWHDKRGCKKLPYFHGARGKFSEIDTEAFAIHMLRSFRKVAREKVFDV